MEIKYNKEYFDQALRYYKHVIQLEENNWLKKETFKWEALRAFRENWDIDAPDFGEMFKRATSKAVWIGIPGRSDALGVVRDVCKKGGAEEVRLQFRRLYDESRDLGDRIREFISTADNLLDKYYRGLENARNHWQSESAVSNYLMLRYPEKYFAYSYKELKGVVNALEFDYAVKTKRFALEHRQINCIYEEILNRLKSEIGLEEILSSQLGNLANEPGSDHMLVVDFVFFCNRTLMSSDSWGDIVGDVNKVTDQQFDLLKLIAENDGQTSSDLKEVYKGNPSFNLALTGLSEVAKEYGNYKETQIVLRYEKGDDDVLELPYALRDVVLDEETRAITAKQDEPENNEPASPQGSGSVHNYYWLNSNPKKFSFLSIEDGGTIKYSALSASGHRRPNFNKIKVDDLALCYESSPTLQVVALARALSVDSESVVFEKIKTFDETITLAEIKNTPELQSIAPLRNSRGTLYLLKEDEFNFIFNLLEEINTPVVQTTKYKPYTKADFNHDVFLSESDFQEITGILNYKKNLILQGAPGVGKTYAAERIAFAMMGEKNKDHIKTIQFHQNYSYEDFVIGYRPTEDGSFTLTKGVFFDICDKAKNDPDGKYFLIIDEINRGNLSKIFGELFMLVENSYRGKPLTLAQGSQKIVVPENLYIIGTMNTADRSLALMDYALRRRFGFFDMRPAFECADKNGFNQYLADLNSGQLRKVIAVIEDINAKIKDDPSLGAGFCIGHSYFCGLQQGDDIDAKLKTIAKYEIAPMLREYWFDDDAKYHEQYEKLKNALGF